MTKKFFYALMLLISSSQLLSAQTDSNKRSNVHIGFIYPLSTNGVHAPEYSNKFSLNVLAGISNEEEACSVSGLFTVVKKKASGIQVAGLGNLIGDTAVGTQIAGITNIVKGITEGVQIAGLINITDSLQGVQIAGFANIAEKTKDGLQLAGFVNKAADINMQVGGFVNIAQNVKGAQLAGFINEAKTVQGIQLAGFINIADSSNYPIGLINIIKNGEKGISLTVDETLTTVVAFRSGGGRLYSILGLGYNHKTAVGMYALEGGLGLHVPVARQFLINIEAASLSLTNFERGSYIKGSLRALPVYRINKSFEVFAGPTINTVVLSHNSGAGISDNFLWSRTESKYFWGIGIGGTIGAQLCF